MRHINFFTLIMGLTLTMVDCTTGIAQDASTIAIMSTWNAVDSGPTSSDYCRQMTSSTLSQFADLIAQENFALASRWLSPPNEWSTPVRARALHLLRQETNTVINQIRELRQIAHGRGLLKEISILKSGMRRPNGTGIQSCVSRAELRLIVSGNTWDNYFRNYSNVILLQPWVICSFVQVNGRATCSIARFE